MNATPMAAPGPVFWLRFTKPKRRLFLERRQLFISQKRGSKSNVMPEAEKYHAAGETVALQAPRTRNVPLTNSRRRIELR